MAGGNMEDAAGHSATGDQDQAKGQRKRIQFARSLSVQIPEGPPDWWKWVIVASNFVIMIFCLGLNYAMWGLVLELQEFFNEYEYIKPSVEVKWIVYINIFMVNITAVFSSWLAHKFGHRTTAVSGAILSTFGLFLSSFTKSIGFLCVSYGVVTGIGYGLMLTPSLGILARYFDKKYTFANAIPFVGSSLCIVFFPYLLRAVMATYGRKGIFFILASLNAQTIWVSLLYKPFQKSTAKKKKRSGGKKRRGRNANDDDTDGNKKDAISAFKRLSKDLFCKNPLFVVVICSMFLIGLGHNTLVLHFASVVKATGSDMANTTWCMLALGLSMILGQIGHGAVSMVKVLHGGPESTYELFMFSASQVGVALVAMFSSVADTPPGQVAMACLIGFCSGIYLPLMIGIAELTTHEKRPLTTALGLGLPVYGIGALIGLSVGDVLNTSVKYNSSFFLAGAAMMLSAIIMTYIVVYTCCRTRRSSLQWSTSIRRNSRPVYLRSASAPAQVQRSSSF